MKVVKQDIKDFLDIMINPVILIVCGMLLALETFQMGFINALISLAVIWFTTSALVAFTMLWAIYRENNQS
jgi:hypothetical protein